MRLRSRFPLLVFALIVADHSVDKRFVLAILGIGLALGDLDAGLLGVVVKVDFTRLCVVPRGRRCPPAPADI